MSRKRTLPSCAYFFSAAIAFLTLSLLDVRAGDTAPISLFDGKTLNGWKVVCIPEDKEKQFWSVKDGAIQCDSRGKSKHNYNWLIYQKEFDDFELRFKVQCYRSSKGNSGVQIRSRWSPDTGKGSLNGPQIDIHPPAPYRTGFIYDSTHGVRHWISPVRPSHRLTEKQAFPSGKPKGWKFHYATENQNLWNSMTIRAVGTRITTYLNGTLITDYDGSGVLDDKIHQDAKVGMKGFIALQLHSGDQLLIRFKDITVLPLREKSH